MQTDDDRHFALQVADVINTDDYPDDHRMPGHQYTLGEMREMIRKMEDASDAYYRMAVHTGCHAFIEFCGLQSKFVDLCKLALRAGIEFPFASAHNNQPLPMAPHDAAYLGEKLGCIYGAALSDPKLWEIVEKQVRGEGQR